MQTKPINHIELKGLKYSPLQNDIVCLRSKFDNYKKNIISYLKEEKPREYMVIANRNTGKMICSHLGDATGCGYNINYASLNLNSKTDVLLHGHPTYHKLGVITTPISIPDFRSFIRLPLNEVVAYNELGQISSIRKLDSFQPLSPEKIRTIILYLEKELEKLIPQVELDLCLKDFWKGTFKKQGLIEQQMTTPKGIKTIHKYWEKICPTIGLEYKTTYTGL